MDEIQFKNGNKMVTNFSSSPLDDYRKKASFEWKKLKILLDPEEYAKLQDIILEKIYKYPEFRKGFFPESLDEKKRITTRQLNIIKESRIFDIEEMIIDSNKVPYLISLLTIMAPDACIKYNGSVELFNNAIQTLGTEDQLQYVFDNKEGKINGTFCLTEIGHGTNTKGIQTTAVYDIENEEFVINSSCFEAAKCWAAGLSQTASHAIVFAQLIVNGEMKGFHGFIVPLRDPTSLIPYPGLTIGDMGEKVGLNGIDNGFLVFHNYRIPRKNLLSKTGGVTSKGDYITSFKDPNKKHGVSLGHLSIGRTYIVCISAAYGIKALTIAIRYAAVRKQFGPNENEEVPILEYQTHQHRLLPHLACAYAIRIFGNFILPACCQFIYNSLFEYTNENISDRGMEIHSICCGAKPLATWSIRDVIQECREACGGHGYLKAAGIGDLRDNNDANCTFEGDNTVIIQQTSNWLLKFWPLVLKQSRISSPMSSVDFLTSAIQILDYKWEMIDIEQLCCPKNLIQIYQWLVCYLLRETYEKSQKAMQKGIDPFWVKNNHQVFLAKNLSFAYTQHLILQKMLDVIHKVQDENIEKVLLRLFSLYAISSLEKYHLATLYRGGYARDNLTSLLIQKSILKLCLDLKDDAVALIDAVAAPDFAINSVLGASDGQVYKRLESAMMHSPYNMNRPSWWLDIVNKSYTPTSKL